MRTFHEMFRDKIDRVDNSVVLFEGEYKQIQLDAYKAGITEAAEAIRNKREESFKGTLHMNQYGEGVKKGMKEAEETILTARDNKTTVL